jgi:hypothetical protein
MKRVATAIALAAAGIALPSCDPGLRPQAASPAASAAIVAEAQAFMADYARDLLAGDRAAIAARYDPDGAHLLFAGSYAFRSHAAIAERYATQWERPAAFAWRNLAYEPAGPDAVVVVGQFVWTPPGGPPETFSYSALLRRRGEALRIRVEDEAPNAPPSR